SPFLRGDPLNVTVAKFYIQPCRAMIAGGIWIISCVVISIQDQPDSGRPRGQALQIKGVKLMHVILHTRKRLSRPVDLLNHAVDEQRSKSFSVEIHEAKHFVAGTGRTFCPGIVCQVAQIRSTGYWIGDNTFGADLVSSAGTTERS